jgi:hypothetical protein
MDRVLNVFIRIKKIRQKQHHPRPKTVETGTCAGAQARNAG